MIQRFLLASLAGAVLSGCIQLSKDGISWVGPKPDPKTSDEVYAKTESEFDQYRRSTQITGPRLNLDNGNTAGTTTVLMRDIWIDGRRDSLQLYVSDPGFGWRFYGSANDIEGTSLPLLEISRDPVGRYCYEDVAVVLTPEYLDARRESGLSIKVWGNAGQRIVDVPGFYVDGFLRRVEEHPGATAAQPARAATP